MAKAKTVFFCKNCGFESPKWQGKCPSCGEWNQFAEETVVTGSKGGFADHPVFRQGRETREAQHPTLINELPDAPIARYALPDDELNRILGGGLVPGSVILIAGEPGIGKSTLLLQMALNFDQGKVLYVSGEESTEQIAQRARRIGLSANEVYLLTNTDPEAIAAKADELKPVMIVVDSVQTLMSSWVESSPGSITQIREGSASLIRFAKQSGIAIFLVGHITKDGSIAGPKVLEHMVDTVAVFEGDNQHLFRMLRCTKNRFGSTNELGIYRMEAAGLKSVENPSEFLLPSHDDQLSGSATAAILEGVRPLLIEVQALVSSAVYGTPQRSATGFDVKRLNMLLAVLEKRCGFKLGAKDVFLNIAGGLKVNDPSTDLAVVSAILSSSEDLSLDKGYCFAAEVGLSGEIRPITRIEQRIAEAGKLGIKRIFISSAHKGLKTPMNGVEIVGVGRVQDLPRNIFG
jgi:DNA repair protein RadA/Sms